MAVANDAQVAKWKAYFDPKMFPGNLDIDRRRCHRTVPMQVLNLGLSRTGTASMKVAFHILGYNVFHNLNTSQNLREWDIWIELAQAKYEGDPTTVDWKREFDGLLGHCEAVTDTPPAYFGPELIAAYPEAKVVIVQRDFEAWEQSHKPLFDGMWNPIYKILAFLDPQCIGRIRKNMMIITKGKWHAADKEEMKANLRAAYYEHYNTIRAVTPPERLLEYELGSGWEPLCKFLGKPIPNEPFSRINERAALKEWIGITTRRSMFNALRNILLESSTTYEITSFPSRGLFLLILNPPPGTDVPETNSSSAPANDGEGRSAKQPSSNKPTLESEPTFPIIAQTHAADEPHANAASQAPAGRSNEQQFKGEDGKGPSDARTETNQHGQWPTIRIVGGSFG